MNLAHAFASLLAGLSQRIGHILGAPNAHTDAAAVVSHYHHCAETKSPAALNNLGNPVDIHHALIQFVSVVITMTAGPTTSHHVVLLKLQPACTGRFRQGFHPAMISVSATVKNHLANAFCLSPPGHGSTNRSSLLYLPAIAGLRGDLRLKRRCLRESLTMLIINQLSPNVD
jgi:hypothetical protein